MRTFSLPLALAATALVTGCAGGSGDAAAGADPTPSTSGSASTTTSPSPDPASPDPLTVPTPREAVAALPSPKDVPGADPAVVRCSFGKATKDCPRARGFTYASATFSLDGSRRQVDEDTRQGTFWLYERAQVKALRYPTPAAAADALAKTRATDKRSTGRLDVAAEDTGNGSFTLGLSGTAMLQDYATSSGPRGYAYTRDFRYTTPRGTTSAPYDSAYLAVVLDRYLVAVDVQRWRKHGRADELAHQLLEDYLAGLS